MWQVLRKLNIGKKDAEDQSLGVSSDDKWARPLWSKGGEQPFIFLVVYGLVEAPSSPIDGTRYRSRGIPDRLEVRSFKRLLRATYLRECFEEGYAWESLLQNDPELARAVSASPGALALSGEITDARSLHYLRDILGIVAWLLDQGALAVYEPFTFRWWRPSAWKERFHSRDELKPQDHIMIYYSEEHDGFWVHTRGLLPFGRPDLSVRSVPREHLNAVVGMCNELIDHEVFGGRLHDAQRVTHPSLGSFVLRHAGDRDDPEFNNVHIELEHADSWPDA